MIWTTILVIWYVGLPAKDNLNIKSFSDIQSACDFQYSLIGIEKSSELPFKRSTVWGLEDWPNWIELQCVEKEPKITWEVKKK